MLNFFLLMAFYLFLFIFFFKINNGSLLNTNLKKFYFLSWVRSSLLEVKRNFIKFHVSILRVFLIVFLVNFLGLMILIPQIFLNAFSVSLISLAVVGWRSTYLPNYYYNKDKVSMPLIGSLMAPSLSLLLSIIEMLTHLFRPITLTARLWVNIWVGHLIIRVLSFSLMLNSITPSLFFSTIFIAVIMGGFFIFERLIMFLQTFVFSFLLKVFFEENEISSILIK